MDIRHAKGSLKKLNISANSIGGKVDEPGVHALADALKINTTITELNVADNQFDAECAEIFAPAISANGALEKLLMAKNKLATKEAGEALGQALAKNSVLKELDVSDNWVSHAAEAGFAKGITTGIKHHRALTTVTFGDDGVDGITMNASMTEAYFSGKDMDAHRAIIAATFLPKCQ
jgi:Ran GTPase-activating protein (RanGAP) involved in mRNA processing and transport